MTFETKKYQVIKNAISYELANFIYNYFLLKKDAVRYMYENNTHSQSAILGIEEYEIEIVPDEEVNTLMNATSKYQTKHKDGTGIAL